MPSRTASGRFVLTGAWILLLVLCSPLARPAHADLITDLAPPSDLQPGDSFRVIFVTSGTRDATSSDVADYDAFVQSYAPTGLTTTWSAIVSITDEVDANKHTSSVPGTDGAGIPIYNMQGERLADSYEDLWDGALDGPVKYDESGQEITSSISLAKVWTGTKWSGEYFASPYSLGDAEAIAGNFLRSSSLWTDASKYAGYETALPLYGMSDVIVLTHAPEPGSLVLLSAGGLVVVWRRRRMERGRAA